MAHHLKDMEHHLKDKEHHHLRDMEHHLLRVMEHRHQVTGLHLRAMEHLHQVMDHRQATDNNHLAMVLLHLDMELLHQDMDLNPAMEVILLKDMDINLSLKFSKQLSKYKILPISHTI